MSVNDDALRALVALSAELLAESDDLTGGSSTPSALQDLGAPWLSKKSTTPGWRQNLKNRHELFVRILDAVAEESTCVRRKLGAVLVRSRHVISTGYNGPPSGAHHRTEETCIRNVLSIPSGKDTDKVCCAHAEVNALVLAAKHGHGTNGTTLYTTCYPCGYCARAIINAGVQRVIYVLDYEDPMGKEVFEEVSMDVSRYDRSLGRVVYG